MPCLTHIGVTIKWLSSLLGLFVMLTRSTCELLLQVWGRIVPCTLILRMPFKYRWNYAIFTDEKIEAWRVDMTWLTFPKSQHLYVECPNLQPILMATALYHFLCSPRLRCWKNREAIGFGVGVLRQDLPASVRYIHPAPTKGSRNQETLASEMTSPKPLSLHSPQE